VRKSHSVLAISSGREGELKNKIIEITLINTYSNY